MVLTGAILLFIVSAKVQIKFTKTIDNGIRIIDEQKGEIEVELTDIDNSLPANTYKYELVLIDIDDHPMTILQGDYHILPSMIGGVS